jgi:hypothetical protein
MEFISGTSQCNRCRSERLAVGFRPSGSVFKPLVSLRGGPLLEQRRPVEDQRQRLQSLLSRHGPIMNRWPSGAVS